MSILLTISCKKEIKVIKKEPTQATPASEYQVEYNDKVTLNKLLTEAIDSNDIDSYSKAFRIHVVANKYHEFLYYSILMAEKNKCGQAFYDTYYLLTCEVTFKSNLAMYYLLKGYELGDQDSKDEVEELFPNQKDIPTSCSYLCK